MASLASCSMITSHKSRALMLSLNSTSSISFLKPSQFNHVQSQSSLILRNKSNVNFTSNRATWKSAIRANIDVSPLSIRPGGIIETDKLPSDVRKMTMDAVDACGGRVTIGDVASKAGIKLNQAQKALQALAADADGFLEVLFFFFFLFSDVEMAYLCCGFLLIVYELRITNALHRLCILLCTLRTSNEVGP